MEILRWYSIILVSLGVMSNLWLSIILKKGDKFIAFILLIPVLIYLIVRR